MRSSHETLNSIVPVPENLALYAERTQRLFCQLFVLEEMQTCPARKREAIEYIQGWGYLDIRQDEDITPYLSQVEPRWNTDIAFRRKDGVEYELLFNQARDCWELTRDGRDLLKRVLHAVEAKKFDVRKCYLWRKELKKAFDPGYQLSASDAKRPRRLNRIDKLNAMLEY